MTERAKNVHARAILKAGTLPHVYLVGGNDDREMVVFESGFGECDNRTVCRGYRGWKWESNTRRPHVHVRQVEMSRLYLRNRHVPQLVHRIEQRVLLNNVVDLHVGTQRTRLVEVLELRHLLGSDVIDNGHGASNHGNAETNDPSHIWAISNIKPQRFSL